MSNFVAKLTLCICGGKVEIERNKGGKGERRSRAHRVCVNLHESNKSTEIEREIVLQCEFKDRARPHNSRTVILIKYSFRAS